MGRYTLLSLIVVMLCSCSGRTRQDPGAATQAAPTAPTRAVVAAANAFLASLNASQREQVQFAFPAAQPATAAKFKGGMGGRMTFLGEQHGQAVWSNFPLSDVPRPGLRLGSLSAAQRATAMQLLQTALSPMGYQKVIDIMGSDQVLADGGTPYSSGVDYYTIGLFGPPKEAEPWMLQFGGHHLALNLTIIGTRGVITPMLTGAQPALYISHGKTIRPLAAESDQAFALLDTLDQTQRVKAILNYRVPDLVLGPGHDGETIQPEGVAASALNQRQRAMLLELIRQWVGIVNDSFAEQRMSEITAGLDATYFAWSGSTRHESGKSGTAYYRIQGPKLVIEFAPQGVGGDLTMHVHTIYRDPTNDYGRGIIPR